MNIRTIVNAARRSLNRLVGRINRRRQWEREVVEVLTIAGYAAAKLRVEYQRRNIEPRAEMDQLIASEKRIRELRRGAAAYSPKNSSAMRDPKTTKPAQDVDAHSLRRLVRRIWCKALHKHSIQQSDGLWEIWKCHQCNLEFVLRRWSA